MLNLPDGILAEGKAGWADGDGGGNGAHMQMRIRLLLDRAGRLEFSVCVVLSSLVLCAANPSTCDLLDSQLYCFDSESRLDSAWVPLPCTVV